MRLVTIPGGRKVSLAQYVQTWKLLRAAPPALEFRGWNWFPTPAHMILASLRRGLHDRISLGVPAHLRGLVPDPLPRPEREKPTRHARRRMAEADARAECAWCGAPCDPRLGRASAGRRCFCSIDCARSYLS